MPIEKRPSHPVPKGFVPHGSRTPPHRVEDGETWKSVAEKYGVSAEKLIRHNFRTLDAAEVNWYLREHVGCRLETGDGKNWRFSKAASPGLIWIPQARLEMDPIQITGIVPTAPNIPVPLPPEPPGPSLLPRVIKFSHEFKSPDIERGYFSFQFRLAVEGEISAHSMVTFQVKKDSIKAAVEKQLTDSITGSIAVKLEKVKMEDVAEAVKKKDVKGFVQKFAGIEGSLKGKMDLGPLSQWEAGAEAAMKPVFFKVGGSLKEEYRVPEPVIAKLAVKGSVHIGLSKKGWALVAQRVGGEALKEFISAAGRSLAGLWEMLVAEGIVAAGGIALATVIGTLGITYLTARIVQSAKEKGELEGLSTWYGSAYVAKVFRRNRPDNPILGDVKLRDELRDAGEKDAIRHATEIVRKRNETAQYPTEAAALERYRELAIALYGNEQNAEYEIRKVLDAHARRLVGL